jgi:hypothetical protein
MVSQVSEAQGKDLRWTLVDDCFLCCLFFCGFSPPIGDHVASGVQGLGVRVHPQDLITSPQDLVGSHITLISFFSLHCITYQFGCQDWSQWTCNTQP